MTDFCYIHIPFCSARCKYCGFLSTVNLYLINDYINSLVKQIEKEYKNERLQTLYFGGGTPSLLSLKQVESVIQRFNFGENPEITFEFNPENADYDYLLGLNKLGVNRLSFGIQTFDDEILNKIGRRHNAKQALEAVLCAKSAGFENISIDLMYGLPNQTIENFEKTLEVAKTLDIQHISSYGLKIEDNSVFGKKPPENLPDEDLQADMFNMMCEKLNFYHYEISNFAADKSFISRHNSNYWQVSPYYGFGAGASGFENGIRYKNSCSIKEFIKNPFLKEKIFLTKENLLEEKIFLGLRMAEGIDVEEIESEFKINFNEKFESVIKKFIETKHLKKTKKGFALTQSGILVSNFILSEFLC